MDRVKRARFVPGVRGEESPDAPDVEVDGVEYAGITVYARAVAWDRIGVVHAHAGMTCAEIFDITTTDEFSKADVGDTFRYVAEAANAVRCYVSERVDDNGVQIEAPNTEVVLKLRELANAASKLDRFIGGAINTTTFVAMLLDKELECAKNAADIYHDALQRLRANKRTLHQLRLDFLKEVGESNDESGSESDESESDDDDV